jgi:perosamine synthetase
MIATHRADYADRMRMMSLHGISRDAWKRYTSDGSWMYDVIDTGYKYNMTDVAAALGIGQLAKCHRFWDARREIALRYNEAFADLPEVRTPFESPEVDHSWHLYVIQLELDRLKITRNEFIDLLKAANIGTSVHFIPLHRHSYYRERFGYRSSDFPCASRAFERIITLPLYPRMTSADVDDVISAVRNIVVRNRR